MLSPFPATQEKALLIDNTRRLARLRYRMVPYVKLARHALGRMSIGNLLRLQFPTLLPDAPAPPSVTVELTNACNLSCTYCTSPLALRPRGIMSEETFNLLAGQLYAAGVRRVRLVGNGEPTLHPRFAAYARRLAAVVPYVSVVTNGNRLPDDTLDAMVSAPLRLVEISVEGHDYASYVTGRRRGNFAALLENIARLRRLRDARGASTMILLRLMLRPSDAGGEEALESFWRPRADVLMRQYVVHRSERGDERDAYQPVQRQEGRYPRCTLPFKELDILWTGDVPLCHFSAAQLGEPGLLLGNIRQASIADLWRGPILQQYRDAHRHRDKARMPVCRGCAAV